MKENLPTSLRDIKPLLEIPDSSYLLYWSLLGLGVILLLGILFFLLKLWWQRRRRNPAKHYLAMLKSLSWEDSKRDAYQATHYARLLATDERREKLFEQLVERLEPYKYRKEVAPIDDETRNHFNLFVQVADESI